MLNVKMNAIVSLFQDIIMTRKRYNIVFSNDVEESFKCTYCKNVLNDAVQIKCGCRICFDCLEYKVDHHCPGGTPQEAEESEIFRDNAVNRSIAVLNVKCPFLRCDHECQLRDMPIHMVSCCYQDVSCEKCNKTISKNDVYIHQQEQCPMRIVKCDKCGRQLTADEFENTHMNVNTGEFCSMLFGHCPNSCGVDGEVNLSVHLKVCPNRKFNCPLHSLSCDINQMTKADIILHLTEGYQSSMMMFKTEIEGLKHDVKILTESLKQQSGIETDLNQFKRDTQETISQLQNSLVSFSKNRMFSTASSGSFVWRINDFFRKHYEAKSGSNISLVSSPFYLRKFGYAMCLKIYPNGDGTGHGTHLSVYFALMKGEYDDVLSWPFKDKVTIKLLSQTEIGKDHYQTFKPLHNAKCYEKPEAEYNIASGSPKFILLSDLLSNERFCKNDTIFLKLECDDYPML